jgi:hypothetical protein
MLSRVKDAGAVLITILFAAIVVWWLYEVAQRLGLAPVVNDQGAVVLDEFQRAKDILVLVFPLLTAAGGYWLGNKGAESARAEARESNAKLESLIAVSPPDRVAAARSMNQAAWK